ncbi:hypothetical protein BEST7613_5463 [Synechocystis sp. PCC 6803]|nr:hypothetical protein BEST7613_5463 [Synechocystis sp. PCC 6803] [Bacillus subtilis BEST7613]
MAGLINHPLGLGESDKSDKFFPRQIRVAIQPTTDPTTLAITKLTRVMRKSLGKTNVMNVSRFR